MHTLGCSYVAEITNIQLHTYSPTYFFTNILFTNIKTDFKVTFSKKVTESDFVKSTVDEVW